MTLLAYFRCTPVGNDYWMVSDLSIKCYEGAWTTLLPVAALGVALYVGGWGTDSRQWAGMNR
jgi:hypothetical protein